MTQVTISRQRNAPQLVLFFRDEGFYPITLSEFCKIEDHVKLNPGTKRVEDALTGEVLWSLQ